MGAGLGLDSCGTLCCAPSPWTDPDPSGKYYLGLLGGALCYEPAAAPNPASPEAPVDTPEKKAPEASAAGAASTSAEATAHKWWLAIAGVPTVCMLLGCALGVAVQRHMMQRSHTAVAPPVYQAHMA